MLEKENDEQQEGACNNNEPFCTVSLLHGRQLLQVF